MVNDRIARAGSIFIRINGKYYEVPDTFTFKSPNNKDIYLSGISTKDVNKFKRTTVAIVKFIEENYYEEIDIDLIDKFIANKIKKAIFNDKEYDIPIQHYTEIKSIYDKIHDKDKKSLNDFEKKCNKYLFK